jgi:hypothetical protein
MKPTKPKKPVKKAPKRKFVGNFLGQHPGYAE